MRNDSSVPLVKKTDEAIMSRRIISYIQMHSCIVSLFLSTTIAAGVIDILDRHFG